MSKTDDRILLIDDDAMLLHVCADVLHRQGHEVVAVQTGQEGLQLLTQQPFALAIVDIVLPDVDGLTILKTIKQLDPDLIVLLMTGYASLETAIQALRDGAYDYLRKPFDTDDLIGIVHRGLQERLEALHDRRLLSELDAVNQDLTEQVGQATEELTAFVKLGGQRQESETPVRMLEHVIRAAAQLTGAAHTGLFLRQPDGRIVCLGADGPRAVDLQRTDLTADTLVLQALQSNRPVIRQRLLADPASATGALALAGFSSAMVVPLPGAVAGAMVLLDSEKALTERQASLVKVMAGQAAGILAAARASGAAMRPHGPTDDFVDLYDLLGW